MAIVPFPTHELILHFVDAAGKHAVSKYHLATSENDPAAGGAAAIAAAAQGISADFLESNEIIIGAKITGSPSPTTGAYPLARDKVKLAFRSSSGQDVILEIGAPTEADFGPDKVNVDTGVGTPIAGLITAMLANASDAEGKTITGLQRGFRMMPPRIKTKQGT
jgi:hypothetical protein